MHNLPNGSNSVKTSNCDKISCLVCSCFASFVDSGMGNGASSKILLPADGVNQSPLLGSSCELLNSWEKEKSFFLSGSVLVPVWGVLGLKRLLVSEVRLDRSLPEDGGGGRIGFFEITPKISSRKSLTNQDNAQGT